MLVLEREERRPQQILVRILGRHPARELLPAAAPDADTVPRGTGQARGGSAWTRARAMREHEATKLRVDSGH
jgi:hypothetical protein